MTTPDDVLVLGVRCRKVLDSPSSIPSEKGSTLQGKRTFKLPVIQFKRFDGNIREWLSFWTQFKKVDEDSHIDLADKVEYLVQATVPGSRARHLVDSFPATGENYPLMIDSLKTRFGRDDLQIEVYVRELLKLVLNNSVEKNRIDVSCLYNNIETQLRALEMLGLTSDKTEYGTGVGTSSQESLIVDQNLTLENRLKALMQFLRNEVENEQRISLASEGFGLKDVKNVNFSASRGYRKSFQRFDAGVPTASDLLNKGQAVKCLFCEGFHESTSCFRAHNFSLEKKKQMISEKKACFRCLKMGHQSRKCRVRVNCLLCNKHHVTFMGPELKSNRDESKSLKNPEVEEQVPNELNAANYTSTHVFLQTLRVKLKGSSGSQDVRVLIDTGSQRSYIMRSTAQKLGLPSKSQERIIHCLFGGVLSEQTHNCYEVVLAQDGYACKFDVLDQPKICSDVSPVFRGVWMKELEDLGIKLHDTGRSNIIELLIGSDVAGTLYTGRRHVLSCGLVAVETLLGWIIMGKVPVKRSKPEASFVVLNLLVNNTVISNLWELDILGISDPSKSKIRQELELAAKDFFSDTVKVNTEGRYELSFPWLEWQPPLPTNFSIAEKRLSNVITKLDSDKLFDLYEQILQKWLREGIIERVSETDSSNTGHYLPYRPVVKEGSSTTKIRPVFDAGAKQKDRPSLNQCLEKGVNLIEEIPDILIRFREHKVGVISDIRKAFLQISINESDRDFLRFLWVDAEKNQIIFRHSRVVFDVNSSPFLLGATIDHHLNQVKKRCEASELPYSLETVSRLSRSFYVDNCVTSIKNEQNLKTFMEESTLLMLEGKFELRGWERTQFSGDDGENVPVLGLTWDLRRDTLSLKDCLKDLIGKEYQVVTKRIMLSTAQRIFDPIGYASPTTLLPKLLLQRTWENQIGWDVPVGDEIKEEFQKWVKDLEFLQDVEIPRWVNTGQYEVRNSSLHVFCDESNKGYVCVIYLRVELQDRVVVHLMAAKSRVAPLKRVTIPRLELLGATIAARLYMSVQRNLDEKLPCYFWSDSTTVISWIRRKDEWATFVGNKVSEIRSLTPISAWRHVPGAVNPADLPSRGCSARLLVESRWWEGPQWLHEAEDFWPQEEQFCDEEEINCEKRNLSRPW